MKLFNTLKSHYTWLEKNLATFLSNVHTKISKDYYNNLIVSHGDKCYSYRSIWEKHNIPFTHGVALYILTYIEPWDTQVRGTSKGWVDPFQWVIDNYEHYKPFLPD